MACQASENKYEDANKKQVQLMILPQMEPGSSGAPCEMSNKGMVCCPCTEGFKYSYFAPTQCYVPVEYYIPMNCCVPVECEIRYGTPMIPSCNNVPGICDKSKK